MHETLRRIGLGRLLYYCLYLPRAKLRAWSQRNPFLRFVDTGHARAMQRASLELPQLVPAVGKVEYEIHLLSGAKYAYQTCFCIYSLLKQVNERITPIVYSDGSWSVAHTQQLLKIAPWARVISENEILQRLDAELPMSRYPALRKRRLEYPHLRKLTDIHAGKQGWQLVLDSDMLFFQKPEFILDWFREPQAACCMYDVESAYGYDLDYLDGLAGAKVPRRVNVGLIGLKSADLDWDRIEEWCAKMLDDHGSHYLQEQALTALVLASKAHTFAPENSYRVNPGLEEARAGEGVLQHYVAESKPWYFRYAWRLVK